ncbi:MAG: aryl-sulfate sulfotransferase [Myxococcota bacterium]|nr:aryl-sulfate sulfotransferase [Myxococcota bacterium]
MMVRVLGLVCLLAAPGCGGSVAEVSGLEAQISEAVRTVVVVEWKTDVPVLGRVEFGLGEELDWVAVAGDEPTREHRAVLTGLPADRAVSYRLVLDDGEREQVGDTFMIETGSLPGWLPRLDVVGTDSGAYMALPLLGTTSAAVILSPEGEITWYHKDDSELDVYRVRVSQDGRSVIYNAGSVSGDPSDESRLVRVSMDGTSVEMIPVELLAHDFVEHLDGTLGALVVEYREVDGVEVRGDQVVEVDPEGNQSVVWSAWDCFSPEDHPGEVTGWTFANALDFDSEEQAYTVGFRNQSSIVRVDRASGTCPWAIGGGMGTVALSAGSSPFLHQHQFVLEEESLLVFDNEGSVGVESRVIEYNLDLEAAMAEEIWSYVASPPVFSFVLGDVARIAGGDILVTWSAAGQIDRVQPNGERVWQLNTELGHVFGFSTVLDEFQTGR